MLNEKPKYIGICGRLQNGKTTSAQLIKLRNSEYEICSFGNELKKIAKELGWNENKDKKGRKILQHLGTEVCRNIDDDYWVKKLEKYIKKNNYKYIIIDDIRFQNEADFIKKNNGFLIHIERRSKFKIFIDYILEKLNILHKSEIIPKNIDIKINNRKEIKDLEFKLRALGL